MSTQVDVHVLRHVALEQELRAAVEAQRVGLRALHDITLLLQSNNTLASLCNDSHNQPETVAWLNANSLDQGCHFDEASLPHPVIPQDASVTYAEERDTQPVLTTEPGTETTDSIAIKPSASVIKPFTPGPASSTMAVVTAQRPVDLLASSDKQVRVASKSPSLPITRRSQSSAPPAELAPPAPEDEANFSQATRERLHLETDTQRHATVAHLPSEAVQEARMRERSEARHLKANTNVERTSHLQVQGDLASSPSSTVGAHSAATPMLPQESPDTSPDSEPAALDVPEDLRPTPEERRIKAEHDRNLAAQKEQARKQALGDISTPDEQLRWEEREAAAREAEEQAARDDRGGPEPSTNVTSHQTEAAQAVSEMQGDKRSVVRETAAHVHKDARPEEPESEGDSITVLPRKAASTRDDSTTRREGVSAATRDKVSATPSDLSIQLPKHNAAELNAASASEPRRRQSSIEPVSPKSTRRDGRVVRMQEYTTPRQARRPEYETSPHANIAALGELASLKGAAEDPERDYLEPLFRIQAHESANINTQPLPELIKSATKALSTDDYFTATHERMDFRMLRRIYQLQNANKWPLRQMEKCKEPPAPITHQDHLMAEMRWMGKDFRAERKMKKSVCAWLARRCADYVAADAGERMEMRVKVKERQTNYMDDEDDGLPELETSGESAPEDDSMPKTPVLSASLPTRLVVAPELADHIHQLQKSGTLRKALEDVPVWQPETMPQHAKSSMAQVSKFVSGKILPKQQPSRKRSRYDYDDEAEGEDAQTTHKRRRDEQDMQPDDSEIALFHPDNKHIRDRLHANNVFRPPSEFQMPSTPFYEYRNGSQWVWEDDQKLRKLAKDYSFNWSLISAEMALPSRFKSGMERRTPWECFERWVELETLPAEMRKTVYFKTWFQRLEQSQQAVERRYNAQVAAIQQAQQQSGANAAQQHMPMRRRTLPSRVEKRKSTRHLWTVDAMRKLAKKREMAEYKKAESARAAAQRKSTQQAENPQQPRAPMLTPQEFSKKRYERDLQLAEMQRQHRLKVLEEQQRRTLQMSRGGQPGQVNGAPTAPRPGTAGQAQMSANGQQHPAANGQIPQQARQGLPVPTRNGHLAVPGVNTQGIPQAHMRSAVPMAQSTDMQRMAQASAQSRQSQYGGQQFPMPNASMISPVANTGSMTTQQQIASNQALLAAFQAQTQSHQQQAQMPVQHQASMQGSHAQSSQMNGQQHLSASPNMPPPPTPQGNPQQLSSGHVPAVIAIKNQLRARYPNMTEAELTNFATEQLKHQSQSSSQVRQSAMNAAAGLSNGVPSAAANMQAYGQNQQVYPSNPSMSNGVNNYNNTDASSQVNGSAQSPQHSYAQMMRQRQMQQMRMQQSPNTPHAQLANSPVVAHASPSVNPASPAVQYQGVNNVPTMTARPGSRSNTPGMMQSPGAMAGGLQGSPRGMQASAAR